MKLALTYSLTLLLALASACGSKKVEDKKSEQKAESAAAKNEAPQPATGSDAKPAEVPQKLTELYPPNIGVFALTAPDPGRSLYFGFSSDGTQSFQMIWVYAVAAIPDFSKALKLPDLSTQEAYDQFMEKWAAEFKERATDVATLNKLATDFSFKVDPAFFADAAVTIPAATLAAQPEYVKITQKFFARRYTTKAAGSSSISATLEGQTIQFPVTIKGYTNAQLVAGKARYDATTGGCIGCHGSATANQDAFIKHSSDYLSYATDLEILNIVKNSSYPDASLLNNGAHKFTFADAPAEDAIIGYLRSFPPSLDKIQPATALRFR